MNDTQGDNFASIQISDNGDTIYLQNENAGLNYEYNVKNSKLTKVKKIDVDNISTFSNDIYYFSDKGTPDSKQLKSLLPLSEMIKIGPDKWVYLNKDKEDDTFSSLKIIVWTEKNVKEYPLFK